MDTDTAVALKWLATLVLVLGVGGWQVWSVRRSRRDDDAPPDGRG